MRTLREWRKRRLLSIQALADQAGVSTKTVWDAEQGHTTPQLSTIRRLCEVLEVEPDEVTEFAAALGIAGDACEQTT